MSSILSDPVLWNIVLLSLKVALVATVLALPFAVAAGRLLAMPNLPGKALISALIHLPLVLPPVVTGYALLVVFGRSGVLGSLFERIGLGFTFSWVGAALAAMVMAFPLLVRPIRLAFESQDDRLDGMAAILGAGPFRRFVTVALPLAAPGIVAGAVLGFAKALGEFGATITFVSNIPGETQTLSLAIYSLLQSPSGEEGAMVLIVISVVLSFAAVLLSEWFIARQMRLRTG